MPRLHWRDLPDQVRHAAEDSLGGVLAAATSSAGITSDVATVLRLAEGGELFVKGNGGEAFGQWMHTNEATVTPHLPSRIAPELRWSFESHGWRFLGFERITGSHVDLAPGSEDLKPLAELVTTMGADLTPCPVRVRLLRDRWADLPEIATCPSDLLSGDTLLHLDMNPYNLLRDTHGTIRAIDWAMAAKGPAWVDPAFLVIRLIRAGHTATAAEEWAARIPAWTAAPPADVTTFAGIVTGLWARLRDERPGTHRAALATAAATWRDHRAG